MSVKLLVMIDRNTYDVKMIEFSEGVRVNMEIAADIESGQLKTFEIDAEEMSLKMKYRPGELKPWNPNEE